MSMVDVLDENFGNQSCEQFYIYLRSSSTSELLHMCYSIFSQTLVMIYFLWIQIMTLTFNCSFIFFINLDKKYQLISNSKVGRRYSIVNRPLLFRISRIQIYSKNQTLEPVKELRFNP